MLKAGLVVSSQPLSVNSLLGMAPKHCSHEYTNVLPPFETPLHPDDITKAFED